MIFLTGADTVKQAEHFRVSLNNLLSQAGMKLRKWRTNSRKLKATIPKNLLKAESTHFIPAPSTCHKALGVDWDTRQNTLHVAPPSLKENPAPTKRKVLMMWPRLSMH